MDPKQMEKLMRQMGIKSTNLEAKRVVIELEDGNLIIEQPQVTEITMQGQSSYQIAGTAHREQAISEDDIKMVIEQAACSREQALAALKESNGDIAEAILKISEDKE